MDSSQVTGLLIAAIILGTPILFAALGEVLSELAGVLNLGVEGMMLIGAVTGFIVAVNTGNIYIGIACASGAAGALALIHAFLSITLGASQIICGLTLTIFGTGLSSFLGKSMVGVPLEVTIKQIPIPLLSNIPVIGKVFFQCDPVVYLSYFFVFCAWFFIYRTKFGISLRALGESPAAADLMGINVTRGRYLYVIIGGMLAGIGGAYMSLVITPFWQEGMTGGRGWISVALVVFAIWNPLRAILGAYLFGLLEGLTFRLQVIEVMVPSFILKMLPYILTLVALSLMVIRMKNKNVLGPAALCIPFRRENR